MFIIIINMMLKKKVNGGGGGVILIKFVREKEKSLRRPSVRQSTASPATPRHTARIRSI